MPKRSKEELEEEEEERELKKLREWFLRDKRKAKDINVSTKYKQQKVVTPDTESPMDIDEIMTSPRTFSIGTSFNNNRRRTHTRRRLNFEPVTMSDDGGSHPEQGTKKVTAVDDKIPIVKPFIAPNETIDINLHQELQTGSIISYNDHRKYNYDTQAEDSGNKNARAGPLSRAYHAVVLSNPFNKELCNVFEDPAWLGVYTTRQTVINETNPPENNQSAYLSRPWINYWKSWYRHYHIKECHWKFHIRCLGSKYEEGTIAEKTKGLLKVHCRAGDVPRAHELRKDPSYEYVAFVLGRVNGNLETTLACYNKNVIPENDKEDYGAGLSWDDIHENGWAIRAMQKLTIHPDRTNNYTLSGTWKPGQFKRDVEQDDVLDPWRLLSEGNPLEEEMKLCIIPTHNSKFVTEDQRALPTYIEKNYFCVHYEADYKIQLKNQVLNPLTSNDAALNHNNKNGTVTLKTPGFYGGYRAHIDTTLDSSGLHAGSGPKLS